MTAGETGRYYAALIPRFINTIFTIAKYMSIFHIQQAQGPGSRIIIFWWAFENEWCELSAEILLTDDDDCTHSTCVILLTFTYIRITYTCMLSLFSHVIHFVHLLCKYTYSIYLLYSSFHVCFDRVSSQDSHQQHRLEISTNIKQYVGCMERRKIDWYYGVLKRLRAIQVQCFISA